MYTDKRYDREQIDKFVSQLSKMRSVKLAGIFVANPKNGWDIETVINTLQEDIESFDESLLSLSNAHARSFIETLKFSIEYDHAHYGVDFEGLDSLVSDPTLDATPRTILEAAVGYSPERKTKGLGKDYDKIGLALQSLSEFTSDLDYQHHLRSVRIVPDGKKEAYALASDGYILGGIRMRTNRPDIIAREENGSWQIAKNEFDGYKIFDDGKIIASDTENSLREFTRHMVATIPLGAHKTHFGSKHKDEWVDDEFFSIDELDLNRLLALCYYLEKFVRNQKRMAVIYSCFSQPPKVLIELASRLLYDTPFSSYVSEFDYRPIFCVDSGRSRGVYNVDLITQCLRLFHTAGIKKVKLTSETTDKHHGLVTATSWRRPLVFTPATSELETLSNAGMDSLTFVMTMAMPIAATQYEDYADFTTLI